MNLNNFEDQIDPKIIERGYEYFISDAVDEISESPSGTWNALVMGSEVYSVSTTLDGNEVIEWECDCPYDYGDICKHVVALLYTLADDFSDSPDVIVENPTTLKSAKKQNSESTGRKATTSNNTNAILKKLTEAELRDFIKNQLSKNRELRTAFTTCFADKQDGEPLTKYIRLVKEIANNACGKHGFIDYASARKLVSPLMELCTKADHLLAKNNILESLAITKALIEEMPEIAMGMDDSDGNAGMLFEEAFETLENIVEEAPPMLKDELFSYCIAEYPKKKYHNCSFEDRFLDILPSLITTSTQEKIFFDLIDQQIKAEQNNENEYSVVELLLAKVNYLENIGKSDIAYTLIVENADFYEFREILLDKAIKQKEYEEAKKLCQDGIRIAKDRKHPGLIKIFQQRLLDIAELEKNMPDIQHLAEAIFLDSFSFEYFRKLKKTWPKETWPNKCEEIINWIKNSKNNYRAADTLAQLFIEEGYWERLLTLLKINSQHLRFIDEHAKHLANRYPSELIPLYEAGITRLGEQTGRNIYEDMAVYLKKLQKIEGGTTAVKKLVAYFRQKYRNRRAMMEILDEDFMA